MSCLSRILLVVVPFHEDAHRYLLRSNFVLFVLSKQGRCGLKCNLCGKELKMDLPHLMRRILQTPNPLEICEDCARAMAASVSQQ